MTTGLSAVPPAIGKSPREGARSSLVQNCAERNSWLHVLSHLDPKYGGVSAVAPQLSSAIAQTGQYSVRLAAFCNSHERYVPAPAANVTVKYFPLTRGEWRKEANMQNDFTASAGASSGLHIHGLWQYSTARAAALARETHKPYVISAHGMLEKWALANKRWKKQLYLTFVEKANLRGAACLHALTKAEAEDYRRIGLRNPIAIIPNGVHLAKDKSPDSFLASFPELKGKRLILFLGRIHFKKGLDILCQAWAHLAERWPETQLVLAGPDFEGTKANIVQTLSELGLTDRVTFTGMLEGESKWSALAAADLFVLPSYSEGLSVSVLEALGMGKPVVITENCNFPEAASYGCGSVINATAPQLESALHEMLRSSVAARTEMGERGERLVRSRYSWSAIGTQMASLYGWLAGGVRPSNFELDVIGETR